MLILLFGFFVYTLATRPAIETTILRTPGLLFQQNNDNTLSNVYNMKIVNKTHYNKELEIKLLSHNGRIEMAGNRISLKDQGMFQTTFVVFIPKEDIFQDKTRVEFGIFDNGKLIETRKVTFVGP
jgi:hypothetical protein